MHGNMAGSRDSQANAAAVDFQDFDPDVAADDDFFVQFATEYQHDQSSMSILVRHWVARTSSPRIAGAASVSSLAGLHNRLRQLVQVAFQLIVKTRIGLIWRFSSKDGESTVNEVGFLTSQFFSRDQKWHINLKKCAISAHIEFLHEIGESGLPQRNTNCRVIEFSGVYTGQAFVPL